MNEIVELNLRDSKVRLRWQIFLKSLDISNFSDKEVEKIDKTLGIYEDDQLVATGSLAGNTLKYVGVCNKGVTQGSRFNTIVNALVNYLFQNKIFHIFVFTKVKYSTSFQHLGFHELARSSEGTFLETGTPGIQDFLAEIPQINNQGQKRISAIVMNANPFTNGHRYLVEQAARESDYVYVFVVSTDLSLFTTAERTSLVKAGTSDLENVSVINGNDYLVSYTTFPAYFLKSTDEEIEYQTTLDAQVFKTQIAPFLNIKKRFVGTEPLSKTTKKYNEVLKRELSPEIQVVEIERLKSKSQNFITATEVRHLIQENRITAIESMVPTPTYQFITDNQEQLSHRIQEGMNINGN